MFKKIGIIGSGVMGEVLIKRLISGLKISPAGIISTCPEKERLTVLKKKYHIRTSLKNEDAVVGQDLVIFAIKPQQAKKVLAEIKPYVKKQIFLSIMAGVSTKALSQMLGSKNIVRCMPNTPAQLGEGMSVWFALPAVSSKYQKDISQILKVLGEELKVGSENLVDAATAVSGSGPAYVFAFAGYLINAATQLGFSANVARQLVQQTLLGSANLLKNSTDTAEVLKEKVTSKGGTTAAAFSVIDQSNLSALWVEALQKAYQRALEIKQDLEKNS